MSLHGHAKIELTNVKTGEIQTIEHDNIVTNAILNQLNYMYYNKDTINSEYLPLYDKVFNGILLFKEKLEEDPENTYIPDVDVNPIVGYASNSVNNVKDTKRGNPNFEERGEINNGFKYVWDFSTSQANGKISAISLTNHNTGIRPYSGNIIGPRYTRLGFVQNSVGIFQTICYGGIDFNFDNNILTIVSDDNNETLTVRKYSLNLGKGIIKFKESLCNYYLREEKTFSFPSMNLFSGSSYYRKCNSYIYRIGIISNASYKMNLKIIRFNEDFIFDSSFGTKEIVLDNSDISDSNTGHLNEGGGVLDIIDDSLFIVYGQYRIYKINLETLQQIKLDISNGTDEYTYYRLSSCMYMCELSGMIDVGYYFIAKDLSFFIPKKSINDSQTDGTGDRDYFGTLFFPPDNDNNSYQPNYDPRAQRVFIDKRKGIALASVIWYRYGWCGTSIFGNLRNYLATINNLETSITKTPDQAMKITYTITEVEDK